MQAHEDKFPMRTKVLALIAAEDCPDPRARVTGNGKEKRLGGSNSYHRVCELRTGTKIIGVKVVHRRPSGLQTLHVHTKHPAKMLEYLAAALIV